MKKFCFLCFLWFEFRSEFHMCIVRIVFDPRILVRVCCCLYGFIEIHISREKTKTKKKVS